MPNEDLDNRKISPLSQTYQSGHYRVTDSNIQVAGGRYMFSFNAHSTDNRYDYPDSSHAPWVKVQFYDEDGDAVGANRNTVEGTVNGGGGSNPHTKDITNLFDPTTLRKARAFNVSFSRMREHHI